MQRLLESLFLIRRNQKKERLDSIASMMELLLMKIHKVRDLLAELDCVVAMLSRHKILTRQIDSKLKFVIQLSQNHTFISQSGIQLHKTLYLNVLKVHNLLH